MSEDGLPADDSKWKIKNRDNVEEVIGQMKQPERRAGIVNSIKMIY
jgi:hypothetical protein